MEKKYVRSNLLRGVVGAIVLSCTHSVCPASSHPATLPASLLTLRHTPSPYECAVLSAHVYLENLKEGDPVVVHNGQRGATLYGWTVSNILQEFPSKKKKQQPQNGYKGVHYINSIRQQEAPVGSPTLSQRVASMRTPFAPSLISFFVNREKLSAQLRNVYRNKTNRTVQLLAGPGGIGKTQLALSVYRALQAEYAHAFWLSAESKEKLTSTYLDIAEILGIYVDKHQVEKTIQEVRVRLSSQPCFYVFDNAPNHEAIEAFLPLQQGHVLITSRNSATHAWDHATRQVLAPPFASKEVMALARRFDCSVAPKDDTTLHYLLEKMSGYPLALAQFFSLCKMQGYSPADYVKELQRKPLLSQDEELLQLLAENPTGNIRYDKSILQVLRTSLEQLAQKEHGTSAIALLSQLAYLDPKGITAAWLLTFLPEDRSVLRQETRAALALLEQYSLVQWNRERAQVYIHEVTQQVIRHLHPQPSLEKLIASLIAYVGEESTAEQHAPRWISLLPHGRMLYARIDSTKYPQEATTLTRYLARACQITCLFEERLQWSQEELSIAQQCYPTQDHPDIARALNNVGESLVHLGRIGEGLSYLKQALAMHQRLHRNQDHPDTASSLDHLGRNLRSLGRLEEGLAYLEQGLAMRQRIYKNQDHPDIAVSLNSVGYSLGKIGRHQEGLFYLKQGLAMRQRLYKNQDHPDTATSLDYVGYSLRILGKLEEALEYKRQSLSMRQRLYKDQDNPDIALSLNKVGHSLVQLGFAEEGLPYHKQGLAMQQHIYKNQDHPDLAYALHNMGINLVQLGNLKEGLSYSNQGLAMRQRIYKDHDHPLIAIALNHVGYTLGRLGAYQEAVAYTKKALAMQQRLYKNQDHPDTTYSLDNVGISLIQLGNLKEGLSYSNQGLAMRQRIYGDQDHPDTANSLSNVGASLVRLGKLEEGLAYHKQALEMIQRVFGNQNHPWAAQMLYNMSDALVRAGVYQKALTHIKASLAMQKRIYKNQDHPLIASTCYSLGEAIEGLDRLNEAIPYYRQAVSIALRIYKKEYPHVTKYLNSLINLLNKTEDQTLIQQTQEEVFPLCMQWLGEDHTLTQQLGNARK